MYKYEDIDKAQMNLFPIGVMGVEEFVHIPEPFFEVGEEGMNISTEEQEFHKATFIKFLTVNANLPPIHHVKAQKWMITYIIKKYNFADFIYLASRLDPTYFRTRQETSVLQDLTDDMKKYYVYVIELDEGVRAHKKFREKNPFYIKGNGCMYIGQSSRKPELRFNQHKEGYKSNRYAKKFGIRLVPKFYEKYNPIPTRKDAEELEEYLANKLRKEGYGVWFN